MDLEGKWKAILIGGSIIGLAPFVPFLNLACCIIPLVGGIVAVAIYRGSDPSTLTNNDGITLGTMSGLVGTGIYAVLIVPMTLVMGRVVGSVVGRLIPNLSDLPEPARAFLDLLFTNFGSVVGFILVFKVVTQLALSVIFGLLGGILGVALLKRPSTTTQA